jgi:hypothetical protein
VKPEERAQQADSEEPGFPHIVRCIGIVGITLRDAPDATQDINQNLKLEK